MFEVNGILYAGSAKELLKIQDAKVTGDKMLLLTFSSGEKRDVGKPVGAVSAEWLSEVCCVFYSRLTDGMMCPACGEFLNNGCGTA